MEEVYYRQCAVSLEHHIERIIFFDSPVPLSERGSLTHSQALSLYKRARDVTAPPVALNRYALRLAGHQSPRQFFFVRDGTALLKVSLRTHGHGV